MIKGFKNKNKQGMRDAEKRKSLVVDMTGLVVFTLFCYGFRGGLFLLLLLLLLNPRVSSYCTASFYVTSVSSLLRQLSGNDYYSLLTFCLPLKLFPDDF